MKARSIDDSMRWFMRDARRVPLLSPEEEVDLGRRVQAGLEAAREVVRLADEGADDETLEQRLPTIEDGIAARDRMVEANLRFVAWVAHKYRNYGMELADLVSEGLFGLIRAVEKFDPDAGSQFATYAGSWIRSAIQRGIIERGGNVRLPPHVGERLRLLARAEKDLYADLGREPDVEEIADRLDWPPRQVVEYRDLAGRHWASIDAPVGPAEDSGTSVGDLIPDDAPGPDELAEEHLRRDELRDALDRSLPDREANVIRYRFGIDGPNGETRTRGETGGQLGVTRERVRQIESMGMAKMLHPAFPKMRRAHWQR